MIAEGALEEYRRNVTVEPEREVEKPPPRPKLTLKNISL